MCANVVVVGAGTMGPGIAQVYATGGNKVTLTDIKEDILQQAKEKIKTSLANFVQHGVLSQNEADSIFARITYSLDNESAAKTCDFMIEAVPEKLDIKHQIFTLYDKYAPEHAILASNTSGIPIREIARVTGRRSNVLGIHFYNPAQLNRLVEIIRTNDTSDATVETSKQMLIKCGKKPVIIADIPGFLHNRLIYALLREAVSLVEQGLTTVEDIDTVVREAFGPRFSVLGLFKLVDIVGIDIYYSVSSYLNKELSNANTASQWIKSKIDNNELGIKTGKGFYVWSEEEKKKILTELSARMLQLLKEKG